MHGIFVDDGHSILKVNEDKTLLKLHVWVGQRLLDYIWTKITLIKGGIHINQPPNNCIHQCLIIKRYSLREKHMHKGCLAKEEIYKKKVMHV